MDFMEDKNEFGMLKALYEIHSPSGGEKKIKKFIKNYALSLGVNIVAKDKNLYITKGVSETYPCIVAHMDQVQDNHAEDFKAVETEDIIFGYSVSMREQQGLGADDKNGIWIALKCLEKYDNIKVAFFWGEEIGCQGSGKADMDFFKDVRFVVEPDRRGRGDLITNISCTDIASKEFVEECGYKNFGYKTAQGLSTDVLELAENGVGVSCINLSCGYYNPHTDEEITNKDDLRNCLRFIENIVETCTKVYPYDIADNWGCYGSGKYWGTGNRYYEDGYYQGRYLESLREPDIPNIKDFASVEDFIECVQSENPYCRAGDLWEYICVDLETFGWTWKMFVDYWYSGTTSYRDYNPVDELEEDDEDKQMEIDFGI